MRVSREDVLRRLLGDCLEAADPEPRVLAAADAREKERQRKRAPEISIGDGNSNTAEGVLLGPSLDASAFPSNLRDWILNSAIVRE